MELYTSLTRLKMAMGGGELPPMTPIPEAALDIIDPAFTPGMGALAEDEVHGLRCPVRECGEYRHALGRHLNADHRLIGGTEAVRAALDIPTNVALISRKARASYRGREQSTKGKPAPEMVTRRRDRVASSPRAAEAPARCMHTRNIRDRCEAQLRAKIVALETSLGSSPSERDAAEAYGGAFVQYVKAVYGGWNNAKAQFGIAINPPHISKRKAVARERVLESLHAWYEVHGELPSVADAQNRDRAPLTHHRITIQKALGTDSWPEAMRRAAEALNVVGGRYGVPAETAAAIALYREERAKRQRQSA